jgi:hypothetical protein
MGDGDCIATPGTNSNPRSKVGLRNKPANLLTRYVRAAGVPGDRSSSLGWGADADSLKEITRTLTRARSCAL